MVSRYRVLYADTDMAGVVYHGNYLRLFEQARTELLYAAGCDVAALQREAGIVFVISAASLDFHAPTWYGDLLETEVTPLDVGRAKITLGYAVRRNGEPAVCVTGRTTFAAIDVAARRVVRLPEPMVDSLRRLMRSEV